MLFFVGVCKFWLYCIFVVFVGVLEGYVFVLFVENCCIGCVCVVVRFIFCN